MTAGASLAIFVASDANLEDALPFLEAFRRVNPRSPLLLIPRDPGCATLSAFRETYGFGILDRDFGEIDLLETIRFGNAAEGRLRAIAAFDLAGPPRIVLDVTRRPADLACLNLVDTATSVVLQPSGGAAFSFALSGPRLGTSVLIQVLRDNLVECMMTNDVLEMLGVGLAALGVRRGMMDVGNAVPPRIIPSDRPVLIVKLMESDADLANLDNGGVYRRVPATILGAAPSVAAAQAAQARFDTVRPPPAMVARLRDVTVHQRGIVMDGEGRVIRESLLNVDADAQVARLRRRPVHRRHADGPLVLLKQTWDSNYGHWLVESLPRLGLVAECHDLSDCRVLIGNDRGRIGAVYRDSLALCGVDPSRIVAAPDETLFCHDLIYPAPLTVQPWVKAPRVIAFLRALAGRVPAGAPGPGRLYVSRGVAARRRLRNEAALLPELLARGYFVVEPQNLDFVEQVRMFRDATHVVGNLGAGLANLAFAPRGVRLLALTSRFMQDDFFWDLVSHRGGSYISLHGTGDDPVDAMQADFDIDPGAFARVMEGFDRKRL